MSRIADRFTDLAQTEPTRPLIVHAAEHRIVTAADLERLAIGLRAALGAAGLPPAVPIISAVGNRPEFVALLLACLALDRPLMPADPGTSMRAALALAVDWRAAGLVGLPADDLPAAGRALPGGLAFWPTSVEGARYDGVAMLRLTSGSTGLPKAVLTTEANLVADVEHITTAMGIRADDVQLAATPLSHAYALGNLVLPAIWQGTTMVLRDGFVPHRLVDDVATHRVRVWPGVPFMFEHVLQHPPAGGIPPCLEHLISAGAPLDHSVQQRFFDTFNLKIHSFYGASETGGITFDDTPTVGPGPTVGRPLPGVTVTLRQVDGADEAAGLRVHVASDAVARGYASREPGDGGGFDAQGYLTGDLGVFDEKGALVLTGRVSSFVNVAGRKVQPEEVARCLRAMPQLADARVVGAPSALRGEQLVAVVVPRETAPSVAALRAYCAERLAPYKVPRAFIAVSAIPVDVRGKTDRQALNELVAARLGAFPEADPLDAGAILQRQSHTANGEERG
jgi:acyl-CoA synthetase (AMP-forming)/AMP-acid ligase II